ncbi:hypothetical protein BDZ88DRAFT_409817 [Geranomyces variabilis]|nr:hypothetical protein BDZ88DRAFT_409817 [Geranomyces variabilis]KAJ3137318.1 hypothetical protein HDU90_002105 [Geranomyces variabilis]
MSSAAPESGAAEKPLFSLNPPSAVPPKNGPSIVSDAAANASEISMATALGACSGFATKKLAKTGGLIIGLGFLGVQGLVHAGILQVNWQKVEGVLIGTVDQDGDGKLTHKDMQIATGRMIHNLTSDLPSSAGFAAAFALGFRYG